MSYLVELLQNNEWRALRDHLFYIDWRSQMRTASTTTSSMIMIMIAGQSGVRPVAGRGLNLAGGAGLGVKTRIGVRGTSTARGGHCGGRINSISATTRLLFLLHRRKLMGGSGRLVLAWGLCSAASFDAFVHGGGGASGGRGTIATTYIDIKASAATEREMVMVADPLVHELLETRLPLGRWCRG